LKIVFLLIIVSGLILVGCKDSNNTGITGPVNSIVVAGSDTVSFLKLPESIVPGEKHKKLKFEITPQSGGVIHYDNTYNSTGGEVTVDVQLRFPPGAVDDNMIVSIDISRSELTGDLSMDFDPSPTTFNKPALLTFEVYGLNVNELPQDYDSIKFVYKDNNGNYIPMKAKSISVDVKKGELKILEGEIPHFSRYGWAT